MKAILMTDVGAPEVLQLQDIAEPQISSPTEMKVRIKAAGVNPVDTKLRSRGTYYPDKMPAILGCDGAGVVEAIGSDVQGFNVGDEVYFCNGGIGGHPGNYAELAVVEAAFAAHKPASISFAEAGAAPLVLITAYESLFDRTGLKENNTVLIHAGAGGVGHVAIQLAKSVGARVITTVSSDGKAAFVRDLGADEVINYKTEDVVQTVLAWTNGKGVDVAFDTAGGEALNQCINATRYYGDVVTLLRASGETDWKMARVRNQRISQELMLTPMYAGLIDAQMHHGDILARCAKLMSESRLTIKVSHQLPLADAADAHRLIEAGGMIGKVVLINES